MLFRSLMQCEESERLQEELDQLMAEHEAMTESYERLKIKLNVKDERLNQKDTRIAELTKEIEEMKASRKIELAEAGSIAEAALKLNGIFEVAQQAADQYLLLACCFSASSFRYSCTQGAFPSTSILSETD